MNCPNFTKCQTELTQMKNEAGENTCMRCLKCHPMPSNTPVVKARKDNVKVDEPWTDERIKKVVDPLIREICLELIQEFYVPKTEPVVDEQPEAVEKSWREQAKELGVPLSQETGGARKKVDVLADIAAKLEVPE